LEDQLVAMFTVTEVGAGMVFVGSTLGEAYSPIGSDRDLDDPGAVNQSLGLIKDSYK
jgi:hypothetical protein